MTYLGHNTMPKSNEVKDSLKENVNAENKLYDFLDANPKGSGREAFEFMTKRDVDKKVAVEVIKKYGKEHQNGTPHSHPHKAQEELPSEYSQKDELATTDPITSDVDEERQSTGKEDDRLKTVDTPNTALEDVSGPATADIPPANMKEIDENNPEKNAYKQSLNTKSNTMADEIDAKKVDQVEETDAEIPKVEQTDAEEQANGVHADGGSANCPPDATGASQVFNPNTKRCEPEAISSGINNRGAPAPASAVSESKSNADIASEKRRVQEYYKKLDRLEALRNMKMADARISAKEKFLREKRLDRLIREAKSGVQRRAPVVSRPSVKVGEALTKVSATEAEVQGPVSWMKNVAQEKNVTPSYVWHVNKQRIYDKAGERFIKEFDANENAKYVPLSDAQKSSATETVTGPASNDFMRIMSEQVLVLPNGKVVTPIRQFCETKVLAPGTKEAFFYDFGAVSFSDVTEDGSTQVGESAVTIRSSGGSASPRGTKLTIGYTQLEESPIDIVSAANRSYALESVNDESVEVVSRAFNDDVGSAGDASNRKDKGGGAKTNRWVDHAGSALTADASGLGNLTFAGLVAAKGIIEDEGLDPSNLVTYTTGKAIRDLIFDPDLDSFISFSRPAIITEATVERIAGTNVVRSSAPPAGSQSGSNRSVMFVPNIAFGLITGRDLTMEAQRRNELQVVFLTGTQRIAGFVKNVEATCRISHL